MGEKAGIQGKDAVAAGRRIPLGHKTGAGALRRFVSRNRAKWVLGTAAALAALLGLGVQTAGATLKMGFGLTTSGKDLLHLEDDHWPTVAQYLEDDQATWVNVQQKWCRLDPSYPGYQAEYQKVRDWVSAAAQEPNPMNTLITIKYAAPPGDQKDGNVDCNQTADQQLPEHTDHAMTSMKNAVKGLYDCLAGTTCVGPPLVNDVAIEIGPEANFTAEEDDTCKEPIAPRDAAFFWDLVNFTANRSVSAGWLFGGGIGYGGLAFNRLTGGFDTAPYESCSIGGRDYLHESIEGSRGDWTHFDHQYFDAYAIHKGHCQSSVKTDPIREHTVWASCDSNVPGAQTDSSVSSAVHSFVGELADDGVKTKLWFSGLIPTETPPPPNASPTQATQRDETQDIWTNLRANFSCPGRDRYFTLVVFPNLVDRGATAKNFEYIGFRTSPDWQTNPNFAWPYWPYAPKQVANSAGTWSHDTC